MNYLSILFLVYFTCHASCSYNEVKFTMSRSYFIDTEGFSKFRANANVYYKYSSTFFEIVLRDPQYDFYHLNQTRNIQSAAENHNINCSNNDNFQFNNYTIIFPLEIDEKVYNFSLTYNNQTYSNIIDRENDVYEITNDGFSLNSGNGKNPFISKLQMKMKVSILNNNLIVNVLNLPVFFNYHTNITESNNTNVIFSNTNFIDEQQINITQKNKRKRKKNRTISSQEREDPKKTFFEASIGFTIFKKLRIKSDKSGSKIAYYPLNYKTCDFWRSSKNLSHIHNFVFKFDLEGHQNDQLFKFGKQQRKCIIKNEIDLLGNPLKFNITENATNKYTFYGFLLKLRLVKFPIYSVINDDHFVLPPLILQNNTKLSKEINTNNFTKEAINISQLFHISIMPKSHRMLILLDDNNEFWQKELENSLVNHFPNSVHVIGHLNIKNNTDQIQFENLDEFNSNININLNEDNTPNVENISKIIKIFKPDVIINFINENENFSNDTVFDHERIYKTAFPENSTINLDNILYVKSHGNLSFEPLIIDKIHQFDFSNTSIETDCGINLNEKQGNEKGQILNKRNQFSFLFPNKCINCTFSFSNRTFHSLDSSIFPSKILFNTLIERNQRKGILPKDIKSEVDSNPKNQNDFIVIKNEIFDSLNCNAKKIKDFEILGPSFLSAKNKIKEASKNIKINIINDCNKCPDFAKICALQYKEEYQITEDS